MKQGDRFIRQLRNKVKLSRTVDHIETMYFLRWRMFIEVLDCCKVDGLGHLLPECFQITPDVRGN